MTRRRGRAVLAAALFCFACFAARRATAQVELSIAGGVGVPGGLIAVAARLGDAGGQAAAADVVVQFDAALLRADFARCALVERLRSTHGLGGQVIGSTLILSIFARGLPPLPLLGDGVLVSCDFAVAVTASPGQTSLHVSNAAVADGSGQNLEVVASDGRILILASLIGDANCDTAVDADDLESLTGSVFAPTRSCPTSDVNGDGRPSAADLTAEIALLYGASFEPAGTRRRAQVSAAAGVRLLIGSAKLEPHQQGSIDVTLEAGGRSVAGILNDIALPYGAAIPARAAARAALAAPIAPQDVNIEVDDASGLPDFGIAVVDSERLSYGSKLGNTLIAAERGRDGTAAAAHAAGAALGLPAETPDCAASAELESVSKSAVFSYLPDGCTPGIDCALVRAAVLGIDDVGKIPDGIPLYRCRVAAGAERGAFPLHCPLAQAASVPGAGGALPVSCADGRIGVGDSGLAIGAASGAPGTQVDVPIELQAGPAAVGALNVDVVFDAARLAVDDIPCRKAARLTAHRLTESVVEPGRIRLVIFGLDDPVPPIASGAVATCTFHVADGAAVGTEVPLGGERIQIADPDGQVVCGIGSKVPCVLETGAVSVVAPATPTPTATERPSATPIPCSGDCDGDRHVSIDELVLGVDIGLGLHGLGECDSFDASGDGQVDVAEVVVAVVGALSVCR